MPAPEPPGGEGRTDGAAREEGLALWGVMKAALYCCDGGGSVAGREWDCGLHALLQTCAHCGAGQPGFALRGEVESALRCIDTVELLQNVGRIESGKLLGLAFDAVNLKDSVVLFSIHQNIARFYLFSRDSDGFFRLI